MRSTTILLLLALVLVVAANAQTPAPRPDVPLNCVGHLCTIGCVTPEDTDLALVCFLRTDVVRNVDLGCIEATEPNNKYLSEVWVSRVKGTVPAIHCYVWNTKGERSDLSDNVGVPIDKKPDKPRVQ